MEHKPNVMDRYYTIRSNDKNIKQIVNVSEYCVYSNDGETIEIKLLDGDFSDYKFLENYIEHGQSIIFK